MTRPTPPPRCADHPDHRIRHRGLSRLAGFVLEAATAEVVAGAWSSRAEDPVRLSIHSWLVRRSTVCVFVETPASPYTATRQRDSTHSFHDRDDLFPPVCQLA